MKREICEYFVDSFDDYAGKKHQIIVCAVSTAPVINTIYDNMVVGVVDKGYYLRERNIYAVVRIVRLGIAICNPEDVFDMERGQGIAYNKAKNSSPVLFSSKPGIINKGLIQGLLVQEAGFIKESPGRAIAGYNDAKAKYEKIKSIEKELESLTPEEREVIRLSAEGINLQKCIRLSKLKDELERNK